MNLERHIAWRYLFSKKGHNAINIVTGVSSAAVAVVTAAMICVLSVMNGFGSLVEQLFSEFDAPLLVVPAEGATLRTDEPAIQALHEREDLIMCDERCSSVLTDRHVLCVVKEELFSYLI